MIDTSSSSAASSTSPITGSSSLLSLSTAANQANYSNYMNSSETSANRWNDPYAAYYNSTENYYRSLPYAQSNAHHHAFHPQYWLHAAAVSDSTSSTNWASRATNPTSYYPNILPSLNSTSLTVPSTSSSMSSTSSEEELNHTDDEQDKLNSSAPKIITSELTTSSPYVTNSTPASFVNPYQNYTFSTHYSSANMQSKELSSKSQENYLIKNEQSDTSTSSGTSSMDNSALSSASPSKNNNTSINLNKKPKLEGNYK